MITKLDTAQVVRFFDEIKVMLNESLQQEIDAGFEARLLGALSNRRLEAWVVQARDGSVVGLVTTSIYVDFISGEKELLIYSIHIAKEIGIEVWKEGLEKLKAYAARNKCERVVGYVENEDFARFTKMLGGKIRSYTIKWEV